MGFLDAVALGLLQGLTEFFPVSSSGHLVLAEDLLDVDPPGVAFEVIVHLATVAAVLLLYRRRVGSLLAGGLRGEAGPLRYLAKLLVASLPAGVVGVGFGGMLSATFDMPVLVATNLLATGFIVYSTRWLVDRGELCEPGWTGALAVGAAQALAILPGVSRSGATVAVALGAGMRRTDAAEFSFLLSVPAILGATFVEAPALVDGRTGLTAPALAGATISAFAAGALAIVLFVRWLRAGRFQRFAYYCWAVGGAYLVYALVAR